MRLPNFDDFEPFIRLRDHMGAHQNVHTSTIAIPKGVDLHIPAPIHTPTTRSTVSIPTPHSKTTSVAPKPLPSLHNAANITPNYAPITNHLPDTSSTPTHERPPSAVRASKASTLLAVIAFHAVLVAAIVAVTTYKKHQDHIAAQRAKSFTARTHTAVKKVPAAAPPTLTTKQSAPQTVNTATPPKKADTKNNASHISSDVATRQQAAPVKTQPATTQEEAFPEKQPTNITPPVPVAQPRPKPPSEYDINAMPFSDALRYSGREWYTKVEKRKKQQRVEPEPTSEEEATTTP